MLSDKLTQITNLVGCPYEDYATGPDRFDCYGLAMWISDLCDLGYPTLQYLAGTIARDAVARSHEQLFTKVDIPAFGDIIALRMGRYVCHVGVVLNHRQFIHADKPAGVTIQSISSAKYASRTEGFYRCKISQ